MNDDEIFGDGEGFAVNLPEVIKTGHFLAATRLLAAQLMNNPYMSVGDFFKNLSDIDLQNMVECTDKNEDEEESRVDEMILIAEMLATAEGLPSSTDYEELTKRTSQFQTMIALESLYRKKLIKLYRENMSFGEDMGNKIIAERI